MINKLEFYGNQCVSFQWFKSNSSSHDQIVSFNDKASDSSDGKLGVAQETHLHLHLSTNMPLILMKGVWIKNVSCCRFLWDYSDEHLSFDGHLQSAARKYQSTTVYVTERGILFIGRACFRYIIHSSYLVRSCHLPLSLSGPLLSTWRLIPWLVQFRYRFLNNIEYAIHASHFRFQSHLFELNQDVILKAVILSNGWVDLGLSQGHIMEQLLLKLLAYYFNQSTTFFPLWWRHIPIHDFFLQRTKQTLWMLITFIQNILWSQIRFCHHRKFISRAFDCRL